MTSKHKRTDLTIKQKMDVVKAIEEKKTQIEIAKEFGVSQTQVSRIKSKKMIFEQNGSRVLSKMTERGRGLAKIVISRRDCTCGFSKQGAKTSPLMDHY